jgi:hypothetical protein
MVCPLADFATARNYANLGRKDQFRIITLQGNTGGPDAPDGERSCGTGRLHLTSFLLRGRHTVCFRTARQ